MTDLKPLVAGAYVALADALVEADWDAPSLCEGWRVREVVAHLTMPARYGQEEFMAELAARDFDFGRLSDDLATRDALLPVAELQAGLRSSVLHQWQPPGGGLNGALSHVVIHGIDVTVPLGIDWSPAAGESARIVLDGLARGGSGHFGIDVSARRLEATDLDWSCGSGRALCGPAAHLIAALSGRSLLPGLLEGEPL